MQTDKAGTSTAGLPLIPQSGVCVLWRCGMKFQVEHQTSYWHDFKSRYNAEDFEDFIDNIVIPNPRLANIACFTFYPDIEKNIKNYPVEKKYNELVDHISDDDRQELYELMNKEDGVNGDHLSYLNKMFGVVETIIRTK